MRTGTPEPPTDLASGEADVGERGAKGTDVVCRPAQRSRRQRPTSNALRTTDTHPPIRALWLRDGREHERAAVPVEIGCLAVELRHGLT